MSNEQQPTPQLPTYKQMQQHRPKEGRSRDKVRVDHAMLFYKTQADVEWQMLERNELGNKTESNVVDLEFNGGIEFGQNGHPFSDDKDLQLRVRWQHNDYQHVWLDQYERSGLTIKSYQHLAVKFHAINPPMPAVIRARMDPNDFLQSTRANKKRKLASEGDPPASSVAESEPEPPAPLSFQNLSAVPLHRLAYHFEEDSLTEILLIFPKKLSLKPKPPALLWSWETVVHLLLGNTSYWVRGNREAQEERNVKSLADQSRAINLEEGYVLRQASRGFWLGRIDLRDADPPVPVLPDLALATRDFIAGQATEESRKQAASQSEDQSSIAALATLIASMKTQHKARLQEREKLDRIIADEAAEIKELEDQLREAEGRPGQAGPANIADALGEVNFEDDEEGSTDETKGEGMEGVALPKK